MKIPENRNFINKGYKNHTRWKPRSRNRNLAPAPAPPPNDLIDDNDDDFLGVPVPISASAPSPMSDKNTKVNWMFAYKFNAATFPSDTTSLPHVGIFGGTKQDYKGHSSQDYVFATSASPSLVKGTGLLGATINDPLGATFGQIYNNKNYFYVVWNDQFYGNPIESRNAPWGHSKGMLAWNDKGEGMVLQVSTPSWPGSGSSANPRKNDGNTLGYIDDNNIKVGQHFFSLKLTESDVKYVLIALNNASIATDLSQPSIVKNGGPKEIQDLVNTLGKTSSSTAIVEVVEVTLSSGIKIISKPSHMAVPPWQMVSSRLNQLNLLVASWWEHPAINSTHGGKRPGCWVKEFETPGAVHIAKKGRWNGTDIGLKGGVGGSDHNHAKIGISQDSSRPLCIFGDMNQQGSLAGNCNSSQNGRGGLFYVLENRDLFDSLTSLLTTGDVDDADPFDPIY
jgi:hypothetical protein